MEHKVKVKPLKHRVIATAATCREHEPHGLGPFHPHCKTVFFSC